MTQNVITTMFLVALPDVKFKDKTYYDTNVSMPLTNMLIHPMTIVHVTAKLPLNIMQLESSDEEIDEEELPEEEVGS